jgi:anaerobic magnesium-protoporphyrin IX monomethyl ester cyclase
MTDILLGQSYYLRYDPKLYRAMQPYPPLGTLYAAAYVREHVSDDVAVFDAMLAEGPSEWVQALDQHQPRYAVIYEDNFNYLSKMSLLRMREAALAMIAAAKARDCVVIVCGADMTDHPDVYLSAGADVVIVGEGEATLTELLTRLRAGEGIADVAGIATLQDDSVTKTAPRPILTDLDAIPFPAWGLIDLDRYRDVWLAHHGYTSMNVITTRGCPFHCNWCAKPIWGQRYNARSPQNVADEILWLKQHYDPDHIWFMDDIMGINDRWIERFADELDQRDLHIPFKSLNRADLLLRGDTIPALARAGADIIWIGAESGSQKILDAMDKGTQVQQIYEATRKCHEHGIKVAFFLQFGYPGETREDIDLTLQMVRELLPDDIGISVSYPLPGTPFHERVREELAERANWIDSDDLAMLYQGPFATPFYRQLHTVVHKDYRSRKTWRDLGKLLRRPSGVRPGHLRRVAAMCYHRLTLPGARRELDRLAQLPNTPTPITNVTLMD